MRKRYDYRTKYKTMSFSCLKKRENYLWELWTKTLSQKEFFKIDRELAYVQKQIEIVNQSAPHG